ncbi:hypothetical protein [Alkalispirochaeta sphaeroplastigenens]|uniref:hypothetical protein n=1 Tax=Alkalispirochaeta sphaeroplastigenens TaxID=1187066 RepID=UPI0011AF027E|nr:hypothetical protein [Alkalispirochaeta sphaeroplastigenens]
MMRPARATRPASSRRTAGAAPLRSDAFCATLLLGAILLQAILLAVTAPPLALAAGAAALFLAVWPGGCRPGYLWRSLRGLLVMLGAVLVARLISSPSLETFLAWASYAARLTAAVTVALTLVNLCGPSGVLRGLTRLTAPLPRCCTRPVLDMTASAVFLMPALRRRLEESRDAARIRLSSTCTGKKPLQRVLLVSRASLVSIAELPRQRAEAMVVRGALGGGTREKGTGACHD